MSSTTILKLYRDVSWRNLEYHQTSKNNKKKNKTKPKKKRREKNIDNKKHKLKNEGKNKQKKEKKKIQKKQKKNSFLRNISRRKLYVMEIVTDDIHNDKSYCLQLRVHDISR
jgi:hypothetical protein